MSQPTCQNTLQKNLLTQKDKWIKSLDFHMLITEKCNYRCLHCFREQYNDEFDFNQAVETIYQLKSSFDIKSILLTGGEIFLYKNILKLLKEVKSMGITPSIVSNGFLLDLEIISQIKELEIPIGFSLDGNEKSHDYIRNKKGAFQKVVKAIKACKKLEIPVTIISSISLDNISDIDWLVNFALENNITDIRIQPVNPTGRAINLRNSGKLLNQEELKDLYDKLLVYSARYLDRINITSLGQYKKVVSEHGCKMGLHFGSGCHSDSPPWPLTFAITPQGFVYPHSPEISDKFIVGNINKHEISQIINSFFSSPLHMKFLMALKNHFHHLKQVPGEIFDSEEFVYEALNLTTKEDYLEAVVP